MRRVFTIRKIFFRCILTSVLILTGLLLILPKDSALAANPTSMNFQGKVVNSDGTNVSNGSYTFIFRLYSSGATNPNATTCASETTCWWEETQTSVSVTNGIFQVELGSVCAFGSACNSGHAGIDWNSNNSLYLTMKFNGDAAGYMTPMMHLQSVPYAFNADRLGGIASSGFIQNNTSVQNSSNFHISGVGVADTQLQSPLFDTATSNGTLGIGTTNAGVITLGNVTNSTFTFKTTGSASAFQVQNASSLNIFKVDSSVGNILQTTTSITFLGGGDGSGGTNTGTGGGDFKASAIVDNFAFYIKNGSGATCNANATQAAGCEFQVWDMSTPSSPTMIGGADGGGLAAGGGGSGSANATDLAISGRYAYMVKAGSATTCSQTAGSADGCELVVFDISNPDAPVFVGGGDSDGTTNGGSGSDGFLQIAISGRYAYITKAASATACTSAIGCELQVWDIGNPYKPTYVGGADASGTANTGTSNSTGFDGLTAYGNFVYVGKSAIVDSTACSSSTGANAQRCEVLAFDVSTPSSPTYTYGIDSSGTVGSGTQDNTVRALTVSGGYLYVAKSSSGTNCSSAVGCELQIYKIANTNSSVPVYVGGADSSGGSNTGNNGINPSDVVVSGRYAYVTFSGDPTACSQTAGSAVGCEFKIFDVSTPSSPTYVAGNDVSGSTTGTGSITLYGMSVSGHYASISQQSETATNCSAITGCEVKFFDVTGFEASNITTGSLKAGNIQVQDVVASGNTSLVGNVAVGGSMQIAGNIAANGTALFKNSSNSIAAFQIQNADGTDVFNVNTLTSDINLVANPSFENNLNGWVKKGNASVALTNTDEVTAQYGSRELKIVTTANANDGATYNFQFSPSTAYSISFWARSTGSTGANINFGHRENTTTGDVNCVTGATLTATWQQFTCANFTSNATVNDTAPTMGIFVKQTDATSRTIYLDGITLTQTSTVQSFDPGGMNIQVDATYSNLVLNAGNTGEIQSWRLSTNVLSTGCGGNREAAASVTANGYLYVIGGYDGAAVATVCYAKINTDGSIGAWSAASNALPAARRVLTAAVANGYLYAIGGADAANAATSTIYYSKLNGDGSVGTWQTNTLALGAARIGAQAIFTNGFLYVLGGCTDFTCTTNSQTTVYYGKVNADGSVTGVTSSSALSTANALPAGRGMGSVILANGYIYYMGGNGNTGGTPNAAGAKQDVYYATVNGDGTLGSWTTVTNSTNGFILPAARVMHSSVISNGYLYILGGCTAAASGSCSGSPASVSTVYFSKLNSDGSNNSWSTSSNPLPEARGDHTSIISNGYIYVIGGDTTTSSRTATTFYSSVARVMIGGALDLVGLSSQELTSHGGGGALTAGNTRIIGNLQVDGFTDFNNGITVDSSISLNAVSASAGQNVFNINNSSSNSIFSIKHMSTNFGGLATTGAFIDTNSFWSEEYNQFRPTNCTADAAQARGTGITAANCTTATGNGQLSADVTLAGTGTCTISSNTDTVNGQERFAATDGNNNGACAEFIGANAANDAHMIFNSDNLPVATMKVKPSAATTANSSQRMFVGLGNISSTGAAAGTGSAAVIAMPTNAGNSGVYFSNCTAPNTPTCTSSSWVGVVQSGSTFNTVTCTGNFSTTQFSYLRAEVIATGSGTTSVRFYADNDVSNGIAESLCGTVTATNLANNAWTWFANTSVDNAFNATLNFDIDYARVWQDDSKPVSDDSSAGSMTEMAPTPIQAEKQTEANSSDFFSFIAATSEDMVVEKDLYVKGTLFANKIKANQIEGLEIYTDKLDGLQQKLADALNPTASAQETTVETTTTPLNLNIAGALSIGGPAEFHGNATFYKLVSFIERTVFNNDVTFAAHIATSGQTPDINIEDGAGITVAPADNPSASLAKSKITGNDVSGQLNIEIGENSNDGNLVTVRFNKLYSKAPQIFLTAANSGAANLKYYVKSSNEGFKVVVTDPPKSGAELQFYYWVAQ